MMNMKTKLKNRLISGLLALAMVLSLLPTNFILPAKAISVSNPPPFTVGSDGSFTVTFTGSATNWGPMYFAIVPNIKVNQTGPGGSRAFVSDVMAAKTINEGNDQDLTTFSSHIKQYCGLEWSDYTCFGLDWSSGGDTSATTINGDTVTVTVTGNTVTVTGKVPMGNLGTYHSGYQMKDGSLSYVAVLFSAQDTPGMGYAIGGASGLKVTPIKYVVTYKQGDPTKWNTSADDAPAVDHGSEASPAWRSDSTAYVEFELTNLGKDSVFIPRGYDLSGKTSTAYRGINPVDSASSTFDGMALSEIMPSNTSKFFFIGKDGTFKDLKGTASDKSLYEIKGGETVTLRIDFYANDGLVTTGDVGTCVFNIKWIQNDSFGEEIPVTVILSTDQLSLENGSISITGVPVTYTNPDTYKKSNVDEDPLKPMTFTSVPVTAKGTAKTLPASITSGQLAGSTLSYQVKKAAGGDPVALNVGDTLANGDQVIVTFTPPANKTIGTYTGSVKIDVGATATVSLSFEVVSVSADTTVSVFKDGPGWADSTHPDIQLRLNDSDPDPVDGDYDTTSGKEHIWVANGTLGDQDNPATEITYQIWAKNASGIFANTGETIKVKYGSSPNADLNYYTVNVATNSAAGGSAWIGGASASDKTKDSIIVLDGTDVTISAAANPGYKFTGWTASGSVSGSLSNTTEDIEGVDSGARTYTANFELIGIKLTDIADVNLSYGSTLSSSTARSWQITDATYSTGDSITYTYTTTAPSGVTFSNYFIVTGATTSGANTSQSISAVTGAVPPSGTYTVTVTATSGYNSTTDSKTFKIIVGDPATATVNIKKDGSAYTQTDGYNGTATANVVTLKSNVTSTVVTGTWDGTNGKFTFTGLVPGETYTVLQGGADYKDASNTTVTLTATAGSNTADIKYWSVTLGSGSHISAKWVDTSATSTSGSDTVLVVRDGGTAQVHAKPATGYDSPATWTITGTHGSGDSSSGDNVAITSITSAITANPVYDKYSGTITVKLDNNDYTAFDGTVKVATATTAKGGNNYTWNYTGATDGSRAVTTTAGTNSPGGTPNPAVSVSGTDRTATVNYYTHSFDANAPAGGTVTGMPSAAIRLTGGSLTYPTAPSCNGYNFKGWAESASGSVAWSSGNKTVSGTKTWYAVWEAKGSSVTTNDLGTGSDPHSAPSQRFSYGENIQTTRLGSETGAHVASDKAHIGMKASTDGVSSYTYENVKITGNITGGTNAGARTVNINLGTINSATTNTAAVGGLTIHFNMDGTITVTGRPYEIGEVTVAADVVASNGSKVTGKSFKIKVQKYESSLSLSTKTGTYYQNDKAHGSDDGTGPITVSYTPGPYHNGTAWVDSLAWTTVKAQSGAVAWTPASDKLGASDTTVTVNDGEYKDGTGGPLKDVWTDVDGSTTVPVTKSYTVTILVNLDNNGYAAMGGKEAALRTTGSPAADAKNGRGTLASATSGSTTTTQVILNNVPGGTYALVVDTDTITRAAMERTAQTGTGSSVHGTNNTVTIGSDCTIRVDYYTLNLTADSNSTLGTCTANGIYQKGTAISGTYTANSGYYATGWQASAGTYTTLATTTLSPTTLTAPLTRIATSAPYRVAITVMKDGAANTTKVVTLVKDTTTIESDDSDNDGTPDGADSTGKTTFTAVPDGTYTIYVDGATTGKTITTKTSDAGLASQTLYYYTVNYADLSTANGKYGTAGSTTNTTDSGEVLVGGLTTGTPGTTKNLNFVKIPDTTPATNYARTKWDQEQGTNKTPGTFDPSANNAKDASKWTVGNFSTGGAITLTPVFTKDKAVLVVTVTLDGTNVVDETVVTLKIPGSGGTFTTVTAKTTGGKATFNDLTAQKGYEITVAPIGHGKKTLEITAAQVSGSSDVETTLNFFTVTTMEGVGAATDSAVVNNSNTFSAGYTTDSMAFLESATGNSDNTAYVKATNKPGYKTTVTWTLTKTGSDPVQTASSTINTTTSAITVKDTVTATASYEPEEVTLASTTAYGALNVVGIRGFTASKGSATGHDEDADFTYEVWDDTNKKWVSTLTQDGITLNGGGSLAFTSGSTPTKAGTVSATTPTSVFYVRAVSTLNSQKSAPDNAKGSTTITVTIYPTYLVQYDENVSTSDAASVSGTLPTDDNLYVVSDKDFTSAVSSSGKTVVANTITASTGRLTWAGNAKTNLGWNDTKTATSKADTFTVSAVAAAGKQNVAPGGTLTLYAVWEGKDLIFRSPELEADYNMSGAQWKASSFYTAPATGEADKDLNGMYLPDFVANGTSDAKLEITVTDVPSFMEYDSDEKILKLKDSTRIGAAKDSYVINVTVVDKGNSDKTTTGTVTLKVNKTTPLIWKADDDPGLNVIGGPTFYTNDLVWDHTGYYQVVDPYETTKVLSYGTNKTTDAARWKNRVVGATSWTDRTQKIAKGNTEYEYQYTDTNTTSYNPATAKVSLTGTDRAISLEVKDGNRTNPAATWEKDYTNSQKPTYDPTPQWETVKVYIRLPETGNTADIEKLTWKQDSATAGVFQNIHVVKADDSGDRTAPNILTKGDSGEYILTFEVNVKASGTNTLKYTFTGESGIKPGSDSMTSADATKAGDKLGSYMSVQATYTYTTEAGKATLETPDPDLTRVEVKDDIDHPDGSNKDKATAGHDYTGLDFEAKPATNGAENKLPDESQGGVHVVFTPTKDEKDNDAVKEYVVKLYDTTVSTTNPIKTVTIPAGRTNKDGYYHEYWPADLTGGPIPGHDFKVEVQAFPKSTTLYNNSGIGTDDVLAPEGNEHTGGGYKELTWSMLTVNLSDKVFNGGTQTAGTVTAPDGAGNPNKAATVTYADKVDTTDPNNPTPVNPTANKTSVNLTENTDPKPSDGTTGSEHDYYIYVNVARGSLYLPLSGQYTLENTKTVDAKLTSANNKKVNKDRTGPHENWEIVQAPAALGFGTNKKSQSGQTDSAQDIRPGPYVTYTTGDGALYNDGQKRITNYYDITYKVSKAPSTSANWKVGDTVTEAQLQNFVADVGGTYEFTVTATYKTENFPNSMTEAEYTQFKADVSEASNTFTFSTTVRYIKSIKLERFEAVNGTTGVKDIDTDDGETGRANLNQNRTVTYGDALDQYTWAAGWDGAGTYDATSNITAKQMSLKGLRVTVTWSGGDPDVYVIGENDLPDYFEWTSGNTTTAASPAYNDDTLTFTGADRSTTLTIKAKGMGENGVDVSSDTTKPVTYTMAKRPLNWTVYDAQSKIWNNNNSMSAKLRETSYEESSTGNYLEGDEVTIAYSGFVVPDSKVGKDKSVTAVTTGTTSANTDVNGKHKAFYKRGTGTPDKADITPALVTQVDVSLNAPSTKEDESALNLSRYTPNTNTRVDERNVNKNSWTVPFVTGGVQTSTVRWEVWSNASNSWEPFTGNRFQKESLYKATVIIRADDNHYLSDQVEDKPVTYTFNGKKAGDKAFEDYEGWLNNPENVVSLTVDTDMDATYETPRVAPKHSEWQPDEDVLYRNTAVLSIVFHTFETPQLQFSDEKGIITKEDPHKGTDHEPSNYVHHTEIVTEGAPGMTYSIVVNAAVKDIYGAQVLMTQSENDLLLAGATLTVEQGIPESDTTTRPTRNMFLMYREDNKEHYDPKEDLIIYTLEIPSSVTARVGTYHLELQAMGSSSQQNYESNNVDVAKSYYTFTLVVQPNNPPPPPPVIAGETPLPMVTYWLGNNGYTKDMTSEKMASVGARPTFTPEVVGLNRYVFKGWTTTDPAKLTDGKKPELVDPLKISVYEDVVYYAYYEKDEVDHIHYVGGYPDGSFRPDMPITRAEVATIIARSCLEGFVEGSDYGNPGGYSDIGTKRWYTSAISYCSMAGVFGGYPDGTFRPNQYITRQELALVVGRLAGLRVNMGLPFEDADTVNKWARDGVYTCYILGYVGGYNDGTFRPKNDITRAETVKIFNGYLNRGVDAKGLEGMTPFVLDTNAGGYNNSNNEYLTWSDVSSKHWAYYEIIEASNDHDYRWPDDTKEYPPEDWDTAYIDAEWRYRATYAMYWNISEGTILDPITSVKMGETPKAPVVIPNEGRVLLGWAIEEGGEIVDVSAITVQGAMNFYGVFGNEGDELPAQKFTVTYLSGEHGDLFGEQTETVAEGSAPAVVPEVIAHEGYEFLGWAFTENGVALDVTMITVTDNLTLYAVYKNGEEDQTFTVTYLTGVEGDFVDELGELTWISEETVAAGETPAAIPAVIAYGDYEFLGWALTENGPVMDVSGILVNGDLTLYAVYKEKERTLYTHYAFMEGFEDGNFYPSEAITRATVADMVARSYGTDFDPNYAYDVSAFSDIPAGYWAANAIGYCVEKGIFGGYPDGTFLPEGNMTRQEFSVVIAKMAGVQTNQGLPFTDADSVNKWARDYVYTVYVNGWIGGYKDGSFKPKALITRAEAVKIFCGFLGLNITKASVTEDIDLAETWTDVGYKNWAYAFIMEATNTHTYYLNENGEEVWVSTEPSDREPMKLPGAEPEPMVIPEPVVTPEPVADPEPVTGPENQENPENPENPVNPENPENPETPENNENPEPPVIFGNAFVNAEAASGLNFRMAPDRESERIAILQMNDRVEILENLGEWSQIRFQTEEGETLTGYVMSEYITPDATENQEQQ